MPRTSDEPNAHLVNHDLVNKDLLRPVALLSTRFFLVVALLGMVVLAGFSAWGYQLYNGIGVAGIRRPVFWGFYITNFVFWIGISHAGTLISAILRLANAGWRRPVTRCAEVITVFALLIGAMFPVIHLGRPWQAFWLIPYPNERGLWPNYRSPLMWDFFAINTYLIGSTTFLILPIIPDFALARDKFSGWRKRFYGILSLGWRGTQRQWHRLETAMQIMAIIIIPVAVSVHTIVSWDFAMTPVPMWHSTIFAPYFVAGAIFSGIAALIVAMVFLRRFLHLEEYLPPVCFDNLGKLLLLMSLLWLYFVFAERLTVWYGNETAEVSVLWLTQRGPYRYLFWIMVACNFGIPFPLLAIKKLRTISGTCIASIAVVGGMWLERYLIIVPSLSRKFLPYAWGTYRPTWVEITITVATFAGMALLYVLFAKFVPIISIWELKVGMREASESELPIVAQADLRTDNIAPERANNQAGGRGQFQK
jgi:Ni/Fe-hydrogenase subunit HybB-like protein